MNKFWATAKLTGPVSAVCTLFLERGHNNERQKLTSDQCDWRVSWVSVKQYVRKNTKMRMDFALY